MDYIKIKDDDYKLVIENIDLKKKYTSSECGCACACAACSKLDIEQLLDNNMIVVTRKLELNE